MSKVKGRPVPQMRLTEPVVRPRFRKRGFTTNAWEDPAGKKWATHAHAVAEIVMPDRGEISIQVGGKGLVPKRGQMVVIPARVPHAIHTHPGQSARYFFGFQRFRKK